jgi:hypothetical protein
MNPDNGLDDRGIWVRFPIEARDFSPPHKAQTDSGAQPVSYSVGVVSPGESGLCVKMTIHFHVVPRIRMVELYIHSPIRPHYVMFD